MAFTQILRTSRPRGSKASASQKPERIRMDKTGRLFLSTELVVKVASQKPTHLLFFLDEGTKMGAIRFTTDRSNGALPLTKVSQSSTVLCASTGRIMGERIGPFDWVSVTWDEEGKWYTFSYDQDHGEVSLFDGLDSAAPTEGLTEEVVADVVGFPIEDSAEVILE